MGYSQNDKIEFLALHLIAFVVHAISSGFAFHLAPPDGAMKDSIFVETTKYEKLTNGALSWIRTETNIIDNVNPIRLIAYNEAIASGTSLIAAACIIFNFVPISSDFIYNGFSRPVEYYRRWIEYAVTGGLLTFALLVGQGEFNFLILLVVLIGNVLIQLIGFYYDAVKNSEERGNLSLIPAIISFTILAAGITLLSFKTANNESKVTVDGVVEDMRAMQYDVLTALFAIFYSSFGIHQLIYSTNSYYAKTWDVDRIYIVLGLTSKVVLSWAFISIARASADELGAAFDNKVEWERKTSKDNMLNSWSWVKWGLVIAAAVVLIITWVFDGPCHPRNKNTGSEYTEVAQEAPASDNVAIAVPMKDDEEEGSFKPMSVGRRRRVGLNF